jgi:hypothetical protein
LFGTKKDIDYIEADKTTLLKETLNIDETTLQQYKETLLSFWDEIPERSYSNEL